MPAFHHKHCTYCEAAGVSVPHQGVIRHDFLTMLRDTARAYKDCHLWDNCKKDNLAGKQVTLQSSHLVQASSKATSGLSQAPVQMPVRHQMHVQQLVRSGDRHVIATRAELVHLPSAVDTILHRKGEAQILRISLIPGFQ